MSETEKLELRAIALWRKAKPIFSLYPDAKNFFRDVADFLKWEKLKKEL